jgi:site-specific DNA recombinase
MRGSVYQESNRRGLTAERRNRERELQRWSNAIHDLVIVGANTVATPNIPQLANLHEWLRLAECRLSQINDEMKALNGQQVAEAEVEPALAAFDVVCDSLTPREQARIVHLLVQRVDFDGSHNQLSITLHSTGIQTLADELAQRVQEQSA